MRLNLKDKVTLVTVLKFHIRYSHKKVAEIIRLQRLTVIDLSNQVEFWRSQCRDGINALRAFNSQ